MQNKTILINFLRIVFLFFVLISIFFTYSILKPLPLKENIIFEIKKGHGFNQLVDELNEKNLIEYPILMKTYGKLTRRASKVHAGEYEISQNDSVVSLVNNMFEGKIFYRQLRLKEGSSFKELLETLIDNPYLSKGLEVKNIDLIRNHLKISYQSLEGLFYPDTYFFKKGDSTLSLLKRAHLKHNEILEEVWNSRSIGLPYQSSYEALILASIIEKEGIEKRQIAGVFIRRLKTKMKLQSDPTIIFALGDEYSGDIKNSHIKMKDPYNTYHIYGLPPGPIGLVSQSSIEAALNPEQGDSLFFVSKGDGTHHFSDTLEEHNKAVKKFQLNK